MTTQHIGSAGELLVQYRLLKLGIDSARLTTDSGVDLVVYSPADGRAHTVQVKTVALAMPAGGKGRLAVGWAFPRDLRAEYLAVVRLDVDEVWIFTANEARGLAQQRPETGAWRLYWYANADVRQVDGVPLRQDDMRGYLLEVRAAALFPG